MAQEIFCQEAWGQELLLSLRNLQPSVLMLNALSQLTGMSFLTGIKDNISKHADGAIWSLRVKLLQKYEQQQMVSGTLDSLKERDSCQRNRQR